MDSTSISNQTANVQPPLMPPAPVKGTIKTGFLADLFSRFVAALSIVVNPGNLLRSRLETFSWPWAMSVSGIAFFLFFLQTGLDLYRADAAGTGRVSLLAITGIVYGTAGVAFIGAVAWTLTRAIGGSRPVDWVIRAFALSYSPALIYGLLGLAANVLMGWNTAMAFGITGALWAIGPMTATIREVVGDKPWASLAIATFCGGLILFGWAWVSRL